MYIPLLIGVSIISLTPYGEKIGSFLLRKRKYVAGFLYILAISSFLYLTDTTNHGIAESGEKAIDLLWFILFLPILARVFNFSLAKKLMPFRKEIGILMGVLGFVHSLQYFILPGAYQFWEFEFWYFAGEITYLAYGFIGTVIAIILTITSNNYSIKKMGKYWKMLHRTTYALLIFTLLHVIILKIGGNHQTEVLLKNLIPLGIYVIGKVLEFKKISVNQRCY